jgi:hypothetical protein
MSTLQPGTIADLQRHAINRIESALATILPLVDDPKQREQISIGVARFAFGFAIGAIQESNACSYRQAIQLLAEQLVQATMTVKAGRG